MVELAPEVTFDLAQSKTGVTLLEVNRALNAQQALAGLWRLAQLPQEALGWYA